jgi:hypothetical protein
MLEFLRPFDQSPVLIPWHRALRRCSEQHTARRGNRDTSGVMAADNA